jgi:hypothetical protein
MEGAEAQLHSITIHLDFIPERAELHVEWAGGFRLALAEKKSALWAIYVSAS